MVATVKDQIILFGIVLRICRVGEGGVGLFFFLIILDIRKYEYSVIEKRRALPVAFYSGNCCSEKMYCFHLFISQYSCLYIDMHIKNYILFVEEVYL